MSKVCKEAHCERWRGMGWLKKLSARFRTNRLGSLHIIGEISPERFKLCRFKEFIERPTRDWLVGVQVTPVQLQ